MAATIANVSDFGGRPIHWRSQPGEEPAVVLVNGCGLAAEHWTEVMDRLSGLHVVRFDRPGMGGTRWPETLPTLAEEVRSLKELVEAAGAPAILVGHSMASFHVEGLARVHPRLVAGMVLVDGSVEFLSHPPVARTPRLARAARAVTSLGPLDRLGSLVHHAGASLQSTTRGFGHEWEDRFVDLYSDPDAVAMGAAESEAYLTQAWDLLRVRAAYPLPPMPVTVLTAARSTGERDWQNRQARLARLLAAHQLVVEGSDHLMMFDRPDVVAAAVLALRERVLRTEQP